MAQAARVLIVAGSDSGGGAGIQADIKTVTALGGYAATAITALTAQNTLGVHGVWPVDPGFIADQMRVVLEDIGTDCGKTGMLHSTAVIEAVTDTWVRYAAADTPLVVDPVMVSQSGDRLLHEEAVVAMRERLLPRATLLTPNIPEAEALTGQRLRSEADLPYLAEALLEFGPAAVLLKGGHLDGENVIDVLAERGNRPTRFTYPRIATPNNHGTGCTLASATAAGLAAGLPLGDAVARARRYLQRALETAPSIGAGSGPVNHMHTVGSFGNG